MSTSLPSRTLATAFASPSAPTFASLIALLPTIPGLPKRDLHNIQSALRTAARAFGHPPEGLIAHPHFLRLRLERFEPARAGISRAHWRNVVSRINTAFRLAGIDALPGRYTGAPSEAWMPLWTALANNMGLKCGLSRLLHYCSAVGVPPEAVDDQVLTRFHEALVAESIRKEPYRVYRQTCHCWNKAVDRIPGWPQQRLKVPSRSKRYALAWTAFPKSLRDEVEAYLAFRSTIDPLPDEEHEDMPAPRPAAPRTIALRRGQLHRFATALVARGALPEQLTSLAVLVEPKMLAEGLRFFLARNGNKTNRHIHNLACFLKALARHWVKVPPAQLDQIKGICRRVAPDEEGMTEKNKGRLRQFDDERVMAALQDLPRAVFSDLGRRKHPSRTDALNAQIALAIEILMMAPMRIANLVSLDLDRHFDRTRDGNPVFIILRAGEVKNRRDREYPLPDHLVRMLEVYLERFRPLLLDRPVSFLFPGRNGRAKHQYTLGQQISTMIRKRLGCAMNPHLFRHLAAKVYLDRNPGQYEFIAEVLGITVQTVLKAYAGLEGPAAVRHFDRTILQRREELAAKRAYEDAGHGR